jgi:hypothetical protein
MKSNISIVSTCATHPPSLSSQNTAVSLVRLPASDEASEPSSCTAGMVGEVAASAQPLSLSVQDTDQDSKMLCHACMLDTSGQQSWSKHVCMHGSPATSTRLNRATTPWQHLLPTQTTPHLRLSSLGGYPAGGIKVSSSAGVSFLPQSFCCWLAYQGWGFDMHHELSCCAPAITGDCPTWVIRGHLQDPLVFNLVSSHTWSHPP